MRFLLILLLPLSVFAQVFTDPSFLLFWDTAKTDTQFAVIGTDSAISQSFKMKTDVSFQITLQAGDTAAALDSTKIRAYLQYSLGYENQATVPANAIFSYQVCSLGDDSVGLDSTRYDVSTGGGNSGQPIIDISTPCPVVWARAVLKGLATNSTSDSTKGVIRIQRFQ